MPSGVLRPPELVDGLRERLRPAGRDDDLGPLGDEALGDAEPDPAAGTRDDRDGALVAPAACVGRHQKPRSRPMSSFMISLEPAQIFVTRASRQARATRYSFMKP